MFRRFGSIATIILSTLSVTNVPEAATTAPATARPAIPAAAPFRGVSRLAIPTGDGRAAARVVNVGHRGAPAYAPENTIAGLVDGAARRADVIEFDVRQTKDRRLILMHDATLARTTDAAQVFPHRSPWRVHDFTLTEIRRLDAGSWFGRRFAGERVPTLGETLRALDGAGVGLLLEVKQPHLYPGIGARIAAELRADAVWLLPGQLIVQSFDWGFVKRFHGLLPGVRTAVLGTPPVRELPAVRRYADLVNPRHSDVTAAYVAAAHRLGFRLYAWTVNDAATMRRMVAAKINGIISNRPDVVHDVLTTATERRPSR
jgi:glycerophosphoryl diester phosphodiesterase